MWCELKTRKACLKDNCNLQFAGAGCVHMRLSTYNTTHAINSRRSSGQVITRYSRKTTLSTKHNNSTKQIKYKLTAAPEWLNYNLNKSES